MIVSPSSTTSVDVEALGRAVALDVVLVRRRAPGQPLGHLGDRPDLVEPAEVVGRDRPDQQPLGAHRPGHPLERLGSRRGLAHAVTLDGVAGAGSTENYPSRVKTFEQLWAELADKAERRPDGSGTVAAARRRRARDRQEAGGGGGRVLDGRRARDPRARRRGDQPAALPRPGADARLRTHPRRRLRPPVRTP